MARKRAVNLLTKAIVIDMNRVEALKASGDDRETGKADSRLASAYLDLARMLDDHEVLHRECLLTAFSLAPTTQLYDQLSEIAARLEKERAAESAGAGGRAQIASNGESPMEVDDGKKPLCLSKDEDKSDALVESLDKDSFSWSSAKLRTDARKSSLNAESRTLDGLLSIEGNLLTEARNYDPMRDPTAAFRVDGELLPDLIVVLSCPRWHLLSWVADRETLETRMRKILDDPGVRTCRELKYLSVDYSQFDRATSDDDDLDDDLTGIEPGYENYEIEDEEDE